MKLIIELPELAAKKDVLLALSQADEWAVITWLSDLQTDPELVAKAYDALQAYNKLCQHPDIRFGLKKVEKAYEKVFILIQAILGNVSLGAPEYQNPDSILPLEATRVYKHAVRLMSCVIEAAVSRRAGALLKVSELESEGMGGSPYGVTTDGWYWRESVSKIFLYSKRVFGAHGITSLEKLATLKPHQIETWLNRKAPFGSKTLAMVNSFPRCTLSIEELDTMPSRDGKNPVVVSLRIGCSASSEEDARSQAKTSFGAASVLTCLSSGELIDYRRITALLREEKFFTVTAKLSKPSEVIEVHISLNDIAGMGRSLSHKPALLPSQYPVLNTRPVPKVEKVGQVPTGADTVIGFQEDARDAFSEEDDDYTIRRKHSAAAGDPLKTSTKSSAPQKLDNGYYACQEGLAKPPVIRKEPSIDHTTSRESKAGDKANSGLEVSKPTHSKASLLDTFDKLHSRIETKTTFSDASRLTIKPKVAVPDEDDYDDGPDELDELLRRTMKKKSHQTTRHPKSSQGEFSDNEMEDAMAALPLSFLDRQKILPVPTKRPSREQAPEHDEEPPRKRPRLSQTQRHLPRSRLKEDIELVEIDSSSSSPSPVLKPTKAAQSNVLLNKRPNDGKFPHSTSSAQGLFLPASSDDVQPPIVRGKTGTTQSPTAVTEDDDEPWKFELDPKLFRDGHETGVSQGLTKNRGKTEGYPMIENAPNTAVEQNIRPSQENLLKDLDDDALFDMLINGLDTV
ncbi:Sec63 [Serendipita sp. 399]|nr:Sec63 [Serendipita sp. 399]